MELKKYQSSENTERRYISAQKYEEIKKSSDNAPFIPIGFRFWFDDDTILLNEDFNKIKEEGSVGKYGINPEQFLIKYLPSTITHWKKDIEYNNNLLNTLKNKTYTITDDQVKFTLFKVYKSAETKELKDLLEREYPDFPSLRSSQLITR